MTYNAIKLPVRDFMECEIDATDCGHEDFYDFVFENLKGKIKNKVIKIIVKVDKRFNPKPIYDFLREEEAFHFLPIVWDVNRNHRVVKLTKVNQMNDIEIVDKSLQKLSYDKRMIGNISKFCKGVINESTKSQS
ncbi:MAG: hypothetical protein DRN30_06200 [Thermoplasmata archaeon]|nr:MAG: hypothetical protein DRN30_06200 [Thermoplasmata archaeon]